MTRSKWKVPYIDPFLFYKLNKLKSSTTVIETKCRSTVILQSFVGLFFKIYTGRFYIKKRITQEMVGYKLGEFSYTRRIGQIHKKRYRVIKKRHFYNIKKMKFKEKKVKLSTVKKNKNKKAWHAKKT